MLGGVEVAADQTEPDRRLRPALGADHPGRPGAGAGAERVPLEEHDVAEPGLAEEPRAPGADRPAAHDDGIGGPRPGAGHAPEPDID